MSSDPLVSSRPERSRSGAINNLGHRDRRDGPIGETAVIASPDFLAGGGEMGALMRAKNWADTPLGPPEAWPQSLKTVVRILLTSRYQMWMGWGEELLFFYNDAYRPTLGVKHGWALGVSAREVWKEIWPDIGPRIERVLKSGEATWDEGLLLFLERSGYPEETYHTFSYSPLANDQGEVVGMLCVVTEETERIIGERRLASLRDLASEIGGKHTQSEVLAAVEHRLGANLKDVPFALTYLFDDDGKASLACGTGITPGHPIAPAIIDPAGSVTTWPAGELLAQRTNLTVGALDRRFETIPTGAWDRSPRDAVIAPIARQGQDTPAGFLVAGINPFRRLDEAYLGFINLVAGQIASGIANAHAYEEERRRAEALAEIDRAKTTFFSNVSHEFRTPLTLMLGPLEDVLSKPETSPLSDHRSLVQVAHRSGVRLLKLVNTLLDFTRIESGRAQANFEPVDIAACTAELASNFRSTVEMTGLRLAVGCAPLPQPVYVDRDMWEKVILNLISNAFKFTFQGEISIETKSSPDGSCAEVTIRDTGTGIPAEELPHLFERFRRVESARGRSIEGSGIGLALVEELVGLHGGAIRVTSQVGVGSAFTVAIPFGIAHLPSDRIGRPRTAATTNARAQAYIEEALGWLSDGPADAAELALPSASEDVGDVAAISGAEGHLVLLADDNADMRNYVQRLLRTAGFQVEAVTDGEKALAAARRVKPDLVLSDVMMPNLDGFGLLAALRKDTRLRDTPVILLSARAGEEAKVEGLSAGADDYLTKPFSARELLARVRANLDMAALRREAVRVENELRRQAQMAQERAEGILASISDGFLALDRDWRFTYVNSAAERMLDRAGGELIGKNYWEEYPASGGAAREINYRRAMAERVSVAFENYHAPLRRWFDIRAYPARDGGLSIYFQDITERKVAEDALRRLNETLEIQVAQRTAELQAKEARLRTVFETSFTYQGLMAVDGTLVDANATSLAGIASRLEDVVGIPFWETPWFTGTPGMPEAVRNAIPVVAGGEIVRQEIHVNLPVGGWRWFDFQMRPVRDGRNAVVAIVPEAVEVTGRRQAEEALRQAQKMEGIGQLTGGVAHDFNNLLTIIVGNLETLQRQLKSPPSDLTTLVRPVDNAMRGAQRAVSLTQRLLAFSRQQPLDPKPVDVSRLVTGVSDLLRRSLGEQIAVETVVAGGLWRVNIDANQLEIAIVNLAVNARDAMPGGGRLTIETANALLDEGYAADQAEVIPGQYVMLAVIDNGTGMSRETLAKAFEPFFTTKDVGHGTGLGLSQVYGFVKQSGGHVKIYSELGEGTTVKIYIPRLYSDDATVVDEPIAKIARGQDNETILVVEDDEDVRAYTRGVLRELGYDVFEAPNGKVALDMLGKHPEIKLLFTDVGLPGGMNGRQLSEAARQLCPKLKVLFTTGYARNAIVHDGRVDPGVQLITKPFTYAALAGKLRDILDARTAPARILVVEDELLIQMLAIESLEELGFKVETAGTAADAKSKLRLLNGEVAAAILDIGLPDAKGDVLLSELRTIYPLLPVLIASGHDEALLRKRFAGQKFIGFLSKPYTVDQLRCALRAIGALD
jgi:signal transduction histidine kinase/DNA-binding response OmpR family regulator